MGVTLRRRNFWIEVGMLAGAVGSLLVCSERRAEPGNLPMNAGLGCYRVCSKAGLHPELCQPGWRGHPARSPGWALLILHVSSLFCFVCIVFICMDLHMCMQLCVHGMWVLRLELLSSSCPIYTCAYMCIYLEVRGQPLMLFLMFYLPCLFFL